MDMATAIDDFLLAGAGSGWSERTVSGYRWRLGRLCCWLAERDVTTVEALTRRLLRAWAASLTGAPATRRGAIVAARAWLGWLQRDGVLTDAALLQVLVAPKVPAAVQRTITVAEIARLLDVAAEPATCGVSETVAAAVCARNRALVALLFDALLARV